MTRIVVFVGPSLQAAEVDRAIARIPADVIVQPPVQQGDMLRIAELKPTCVAIIDGVFFQLPSVTHKEIMLTLERGVRVIGAASLGALRAAELDVFGMHGVGEIYQMYRRGAIDGDDEVAVMHGNAEDGYVAYTEPLVSARYNIARARRRGVVSSITARAVLKAGKQLHFTRRTYRAMLHAAAHEVPDAELLALQAFLEDEAVDLKRADALALLDLLTLEPTTQAATRPTTHRTVYTHLASREYTGRTRNGHYVSDTFVHSMVKLLSPRASRLRRQAALVCLAVEQARHLRLAGHVAAATSDDSRCLSAEELTQALTERESARRVMAEYEPRRLIHEVASRHGVSARLLLAAPRMQPGVPWDSVLLREVKLSGEFAQMVDHAVRVQACAENMAQRMPGLLESLSSARIEQWAARTWRIDQPALGRHLVLRGFGSYREFVDVARLAYAYEWLYDATLAQQIGLQTVVGGAGAALEVR